MLNIGLIGNTQLLEPHVIEIKKNTEINIVGKSSVGTNAELNSFHFSIPELNKIELIERVDILLMDNSTPMPFKLMRDIIKRSKHIFCTEYPCLSIKECNELIKLSKESGSIIQVSNPYYFLPAIQWMNDSFKKPIFINYSSVASSSKKEQSLFPMLLMLIGSTGLSPKRIAVANFIGNKDCNFTNVRLEFKDASVANFNLSAGNLSKKFNIEVYSNNQFADFNFKKNKFLLDAKPLSLQDSNKTHELTTFVHSILGRAKQKSTLEDYSSAMEIVQDIEKKINQLLH